jgi:hypothetical protein
VYYYYYFFCALGTQFARDLKINGGRLKDTGNTNGIVPLYRNGYPLKQQGRFTAIRSGGGDAFTNVPNERLAFSADRAKSLNGHGRK